MLVVRVGAEVPVVLHVGAEEDDVLRVGAVEVQVQEGVVEAVVAHVADETTRFAGDLLFADRPVDLVGDVEVGDVTRHGHVDAEASSRDVGEEVGVDDPSLSVPPPAA